MDKNECFHEIVVASKELGKKPVTAEYFYHQEWTNAMIGLQILKENGIVYRTPKMYREPVYPCLILSDSKDLQARENSANATTKTNNFSAEYREIRKLHIAELASTLGIISNSTKNVESKIGRKPIRVYFEGESGRIKPLLERMAREEGIRIRK